MYSCIITAGGSGNRFDKHRKKQFFTIDNKPILNITIENFYRIDEINEIIISLPADEYENISKSLVEIYSNKVKCVVGGVTRQASVLNALNICNESNEYVMIQDAVRPFINKDDLKQMMLMMKDSHAVIPGNKVKNTIKKVINDKIIETIDREDLIEVYTPQIFDLKMVRDFHLKVKDSELVFTDDASIFEYFKEPVIWYETKDINIKITTKEDLKYAEYLWHENNTLP